jgi:hypothetical protein
LSPESARAKISRRSWLLAGLTIPLFRARAAAGLTVTSDGDNLHLVAPQLHFLSGKPLVRLQDGATVSFFSQITLLEPNRATEFRRAQERLTVSYDVWDAKFRVKVGTGGRLVSGLTAPEAENLCMDNLAISALGLAPDRAFFLRFELRTLSPRELSAVVDGSGISMTRLIEAFSRKPHPDEDSWGPLMAGPLRLMDLARTSGRRTRNG